MKSQVSILVLDKFYSLDINSIRFSYSGQQSEYLALSFVACFWNRSRIPGDIPTSAS